MSRTLNKTWPWAAGLAAWYLLPWAGFALAQSGSPTDAAGLGFAALLLLNPGASFLAGALVGYRHGFSWLLLPLVAVAWVPAVYLVYNDSALPYALLYMAFALAGLGAGVGVRAALARRRPSVG